jgi:hypothetical protein
MRASAPRTLHDSMDPNRRFQSPVVREIGPPHFAARSDRSTSPPPAPSQRDLVRESLLRRPGPAKR